MRNISIILSLIWGLSAWSANLASSANLNKDGVILDGFDVVSYFSPLGPQKGSATFQLERSGIKFWFYNEANKQTFLKDPIKYEPQYLGWCAYAVAESKEKSKVEPKSFLVQDGKLLVFYNGFWGDSRDKWLHSKNKTPDLFFEQAEKNWPEVQKKNP